jgi:ATP-binding cassette subfamily B protein
MTAIVGPSGSGKSTVINLIARFWDVDDGQISIGGIDIREIEPAHLSSLISVVFQQDHLFSGTVRSNIAIAKPDASQDDIEAAARKARAHDFIATLPDSYDTQMGEGGARFSGGERQRIAIARAILKDAPIVLLDEATSALDSTNERAIQEALQALVADKTLIVVAHKLSTIEAADQILVLQDGTIHQSGDHASLLQGEGLYARMYARKSQAETWRLTQPRQTEDAL